MDLETAIKGRRSIRKFQSTPVPKEVLERVFEMAMWAPSGWNNQGYFFAVVQGEKKEELLRLFASALPEVRPSLEKIYPDKPQYVDGLLEFFRTFGGAPVLVFAFAGLLPDGEPDLMSTSAALQNLFLAAYEAGLGATWTDSMRVREREICEMLGLERRRLVCISPLGYPSETPAPPPRREGRIAWVGF